MILHQQKVMVSDILYSKAVGAPTMEHLKHC